MRVRPRPRRCRHRKGCGRRLNGLEQGGELFIAARVVWSDATSAGLEFYREVPLEEVTAMFATV